MYVGGRAKYFVVAKSIKDIKEALLFAKKKKLPVFILGGGSNIIVADKGFPGLVIKIEVRGIKKISEDQQGVCFEVGAGKTWDDFVKFSINKNLFGLENLSHIPGTVGASVVQNIGAYGQEVSEVVSEARVLDINTLQEKTLKNKDCKFSYRKSIFNDLKESKGKFVVLSVTFKLRKKGKFSLKYSDFRHLEAELPNELTLRRVRKEIIKARDRKFPYPDKPQNGTVGSFWNAEAVNTRIFEMLINKLYQKGFTNKADEMRNKRSAFTVAQGFKLVPGLFIEILGYKGKKIGNVRILETHAGIINNFSGKATAKEIMDLSNQILEKVYREFGVRLKIEPELVGDFN